MNNSKTRTGMILLQLFLCGCNNAIFAQDSIAMNQDSIINELAAKVSKLELQTNSIEKTLSESANHQDLISGFPNIYLTLILFGIAVLIGLYAIYAAYYNLETDHSNSMSGSHSSNLNCDNTYRNLETDMLSLKNRVSILEKQLNKLRPTQPIQKTEVIQPTPRQNATQVKQNVSKSNDKVAKIVTKQPETREYVWLKVVDGGKLSIAQSADVAIYRAWICNGIYSFEFCCAKTGKAINNRTSVIDPFCEVQPNGIDPDLAKSVNIMKPGSLSVDFQVITKVIIQYC